MLSRYLTTMVIISVIFLASCNNNRDSISGKVAAESSYKTPITEQDIQDDSDALSIEIGYLLGKFNPTTHPLFKKAEKPLTSRSDAWLREETLEAFKKMHQAAKAEGVSLSIVSATRNYNAQKVIWEAKWNGSRLVEGKNLSKINDPIERAKIILKYSSMPGTSRHHWGTDVDINSVEPSYFKTPKGSEEYEWLAKNGSKFGFYQAYTPKGELRPTGYEEEPWHWSYTPLSSPLLKRYNKLISYQILTGFAGSETAESLNVIRDYVNGINPKCR